MCYTKQLCAHDVPYLLASLDALQTVRSCTVVEEQHEDTQKAKEQNNSKVPNIYPHIDTRETDFLSGLGNASLSNEISVNLMSHSPRAMASLLLLSQTSHDSPESRLELHPFARLGNQNTTKSCALIPEKPGSSKQAALGVFPIALSPLGKQVKHVHW